MSPTKPHHQGVWRRAWPRIRHWLYWTHRWLGIGGCLLFVMWFASGVVMMYVGYPNLTDEELSLIHI